MSLRQRKGSPVAGGGMEPSAGDTGKDRRSRRGESIDRTFTRVVMFVAASAALTLGGLVFVYPSANELLLDRVFGLRPSSSKEYAVVVDAGSTGSRVLGFTFVRRPDDGRLELHDELWMQVKPGLSSYADDPPAAVAGLEELLDAARARIPPSARPSTPLTLKATAGLRLLPKHKSEAILSEAAGVLSRSGFRTVKNPIEIMNPMEEGLFGWFTVNFLLGRLEKSSPSWSDGSFASLDLGGGSTQVTFAPSKPIGGLEGRKHFLHNVSVLGEDVEVYSHSYLGLGLVAARKAAVEAENAGAGEESSVQLSCLTSDTPKAWSYGGREYLVSRKPTSSLASCSDAVKRVIAEAGVHRPEELKYRSVAAFSYFFDLANEHGHVEEGRFEAKVTVGSFLEMARKACMPQGRGFNCHDLVFIHLLMTEGYGLPDDKVIHLYKKIDGHEASWALGLAYNILEAKA